MKAIKGSLLSAGLTTVLILGFFACQKPVSELPSITSAVKGGDKPPAPGFIFTIPMAAVICNSQIYFFVGVTDVDGNDLTGDYELEVHGYNLENVEADVGLWPGVCNTCTGSQVNFGFSGIPTGNYVVKATFDYTPQGGKHVHAAFSFNLAVNPADECDFSCQNYGLTLSRTAIITTSADFIPLSVKINYTVTNCSETDYAGLELQGNMISEASDITDSFSGDATNLHSVLKGNPAQRVLYSRFDLAAGKSQSFFASYKVYPLPCGDALTGVWSLTKNGVVVGTVAPSVDALGTTGFLDRPFYIGTDVDNAPACP